MQSRLNPYINFNGNAREALNFYQSVFGGKLEVTTMKEGGMSSSPEMDDALMHGMLSTDGGMVLMASDGMDDVAQQSNITISLSGDNDAELSGCFDGLAAGGTITQPLMSAPWGDKFGMLTDKFGVGWMVNIAGQHQ